MKMDFSSNRRTFLKNITIVGGGLTLTALLGSRRPAAARVKNDPPAKDTDSAGYRLTEHIQKYYDTAKL